MKQLPQNLEMEQQVLGTLMVQEESICRVEDIIQPSDISAVFFILLVQARPDLKLTPCFPVKCSLAGPSWHPAHTWASTGCLLPPVKWFSS